MNELFKNTVRDYSTFSIFICYDSLRYVEKF